jgi:hypothetical protein
MSGTLRCWKIRLSVLLVRSQKLKRHRHLLTHDLLERDGLVRGDQVELKAEELGDPLVAREPGERECIRPERRVDEECFGLAAATGTTLLSRLS